MKDIILTSEFLNNYLYSDIVKTITLDGLDIQALGDQLRSGSVFVYPTKTVAGIGCIGSNKKAVERVFKAKQRDLSKPVSYAFNSREMIERYALVDRQASRLMKLLPGPVTLVLPRNPDSPNIYGIADTSIGIRVPNVQWLLDLIGYVGEPIITTSANIAGSPAANCVSDLEDEFIKDIDVLLSWEGNLKGLSSTVVSLIDGVKILREGAINEDKIQSILDL